MQLQHVSHNPLQQQSLSYSSLFKMSAHISTLAAGIPVQNSPCLCCFPALIVSVSFGYSLLYYGTYLPKVHIEICNVTKRATISTLLRRIIRRHPHSLKQQLCQPEVCGQRRPFMWFCSYIPTCRLIGTQSQSGMQILFIMQKKWAQPCYELSVNNRRLHVLHPYVH